MGASSFGKYRLIAELGHGGMADVFLAVIAGPLGSGFSKLTVIKRLRQNLAEEPEFVAMLVDEARIAARLNHPNVVQTNEVGQVGNHYFLAMEYLDGQPLHRVQHRAQTILSKPRDATTKPDPFPRDLQYLVLLDALAGLHHAHDLADYDGTPLQIVHRDVTPHNIFVTYEGQVKVVDFGIAKAVGRASETRQGVVKGKVRYMAPEQAIGQAVDRRADLFSIGIMLWEAAAGRRLWKDLDDLEILQHLVSGDIPSSPKAIEPTVPDAIDAICRKALAAHADSRFQTADEFRTALETYLAESGALVSARRKLGPAVSDLFKDKRQEIKAVIEQQLAVLSTRPSGELATVEIADASTSMPTPSSTGTISVSIEGTASALMANAPTEVYQPERAPRRSRRFGLAALLGVGVIAAVGLAVRLGGTKTARIEAALAPAPSAASSASKPDQVRIRLTVSPANAMLTLDGQRVDTPFELKAPRDAKDHVVKVEAPGFEPRTEKIQFANDLTMVFELVKSAAPPAQVAAAPRRPPPPAWRPPPPAPPAPKAQPDSPSTTAAPIPPLRGDVPTAPARQKPDTADPWAH